MIASGSITVTAATQITADQTIITGTANSYGTEQTNGTSDAIADMNTWNGWQEFSLATPQGLTALQQLELANHSDFNSPQDDNLAERKQRRLCLPQHLVSAPWSPLISAATVTLGASLLAGIPCAYAVYRAMTLGSSLRRQFQYTARNCRAAHHARPQQPLHGHGRHPRRSWQEALSLMVRMNYKRRPYFLRRRKRLSTSKRQRLVHRISPTVGKGAA